jgi:dienelactone hydrolase
MNKKFFWLLVPGLLIGASGCPDIKVDTNEGVAGPMVEFDPANAVIPFPNNLVLDRATGKVNLPKQCGESPATTATRVNVLNKLDGFGTFELGMRVTFTEAVDPASLANNIVLYKRAAGGTDVSPAAATLVPVTTRVGTTSRFDAACANPVDINSVTIIPLVPLDQKSTYTAAVLSGVKTAQGVAFTPAFTWALIRQSVDPVTVDAMGNVVVNRTPLNPSDPAQAAQIQGIDLLWKAHAKALAFLEGTGHARTDVLVAWDFNTQTVTDPLDPTVATSPAGLVATGALLGVQSITCNFDPTTCPRGNNRAAPPFVLCDPAGGGPGGDSNVQCFLKISLGAAAGAPANAIYATGNAICGQVGCAAVRDVIAGGLGSRNYQAELPAVIPAPTTGPTAGNPNFGGTIPGPWADPIAPAVVNSNIIQVLAVIPVTAGNGPYPTVVFGHGLGSSKKTAIAIAPQLAANGYATVAIDFVAHDSRAVRTSTEATIGCANNGTTGAAPDPTKFPQCYAPFLSPDLANTRDNIRQSILDVQGLVEALKACGPSACTQAANLSIDAAHIQYLGISLGGIMGSTAVATKPDFKAAALNVPGVGWADILENTQTLAIRCQLVDGLIDAGILVGDKANAPLYTTGLCTTDAWKTQAGYQQFAAIGRWVLDPADGANFTRMLAARRILIQEVVGDKVVPNIATDNEAALVGLTAQAADPGVPNAAPPPPMLPSAAITTMPMTNKFVKYTNLPAAGAFPGNTFQHASLLSPTPGADGSLGTARVQTDAITFLRFNLTP